MSYEPILGSLHVKGGHFSLPLTLICCHIELSLDISTPGLCSLGVRDLHVPKSDFSYTMHPNTGVVLSVRS